MNSVWVPSLVFYNTLNEDKTLVDFDSNIFVGKKGDFVFADSSVIDETQRCRE